MIKHVAEYEESELYFGDTEHHRLHPAGRRPAANLGQPWGRRTAGSSLARITFTGQTLARNGSLPSFIRGVSRDTVLISWRLRNQVSRPTARPGWSSKVEILISKHFLSYSDDRSSFLSSELLILVQIATKMLGRHQGAQHQVRNENMGCSVFSFHCCSIPKLL